MIKPIQYLRGLAAMMVVWHHSVGQVEATRQFIKLPAFGPYGVDLFFAISGFIMLVTTWDKKMMPWEFMRHRIRRIVPLYWIATLSMLAAALIAPFLFKSLKFDSISLFKSLFFIPYESLSDPGTMFPLLAPGWTLDYEMFFYVLFAIALWLKRDWRLPLLIGALAALVIGGYLLQPTYIPAQVYTSPRLLEFGAGMIIGRLWLIKKSAPSKRSHPLFLALGDASYSIYLTHIFTLGALRFVWVRLVPNASMTSSVILMVVSLTISAFVGWLCYRWVELPMNSRRRRIETLQVPSN
jgi:exopolysaccharide production protein ExoZ